MNSEARNTGKKYTVAIIGAGRIGTGFDGPHSQHILTHAHAFFANSRTDLVALVDTDLSRVRREAKRWDTLFFPDVERMFSAVRPDIVVIATPDDTHAVLLEKITMLHPRLIICEKPPVQTLEEVRRVERATRSSHIPVIVNYTRRFDTTVCQIRKNIKKGTYGRVISGSCIYTKGLLHNGSHLVDLARFLFGEMDGCVRFPAGKNAGRDERVSGIASFEMCPQFHIITGDENRYSIGEFDIFTEKARLRFTNSGIDLSVQKVVADKIYKGYHVLGATRTEKTGLLRTLSELARHAVAILDGKERPRSTLSDALKTHATCLALARGFKRK